MDAVFRALGDAHRRKLLDSLRARDGQTLTELEATLDMTRFGVMKHLKVLEEASLIATRKVGRHKYHYLNPVPIQEIADRWIARFAEPWAQAMATLKTTLESEDLTMTAKPNHVFSHYIRTTPERLWQALTDPKMTPFYYFGGRVDTDLKVGGPFRYLSADGQVMVDGRVLAVEPCKRLVTSFDNKVCPAASGDAPSRVTYEIEAQGEVCKLTLIHDDFAGETEGYKATGEVWPRILSGLKTLIETGKPLEAAESQAA